MATNVPQPSFGPLGFQTVPDPLILAGVIADMQAAFGNQLNLSTTNTTSLETPHGQLASSLTAIISDCYAQDLAIASGTDPLYAQGRMQDALGYIYFMTRLPATSTTVPVLCQGVSGTIIPLAAQAIDGAGNLWAPYSSPITIGAGGTGTGEFYCLTPGPVTCSIGYLNGISTTIPGWGSISNTGDPTVLGTIGRSVETQQEFEARRLQSVSANAIGILPAIRAAVLASGTDLTPPQPPLLVYTSENVTSAPVTIGTVSLLPHSILVSVAGGNSAAIAQAIWSKNSGGADYNGNTTVTITDSSNLPSAPYPIYPVTYWTATGEPVYLAVTLRNVRGLPANIVALTQEAVVNTMNSVQAIGTTIYASQFFSAIYAISSFVEIISLYIGLASTPVSSSVSLEMNQYPTVTELIVSGGAPLQITTGLQLLGTGINWVTLGVSVGSVISMSGWMNTGNDGVALAVSAITTTTTTNDTLTVSPTTTLIAETESEGIYVSLLPPSYVTVALV